MFATLSLPSGIGLITVASISTSARGHTTTPSVPRASVQRARHRHAEPFSSARGLGLLCRSSANDEGSSDSSDFRKALSKAKIAEESAAADDDTETLTGEELVQLIRDKWGARYDCRITRRRNGVGKLRFYLQVMWKFLEQKSFPLSEEEYYEQLDAVASLVSEWGLAEYVRNEIRASKMNPVIGNTIGGGARCVSIPLLDSDEVR